MRLLFVAFLVLAGCVSSSEHERLERQLQLETLEKNNALHAKKSAEKDLTDANEQIATLERKLSEASGTASDRAKTVSELEADLEKAYAKASSLEQRLTALRTLIESAKLPTRLKKALLEEMGQAAVDPGAPADLSEPLDDTITH